MGIQSMLRDRGQGSATSLYADSSAALAIAKRKGVGRLRHINVSALWIQDVQDREGAAYTKILGTNSPADLMTKYLARDQSDKHIPTMGQVSQGGRADKGLEMQKRVSANNKG